MMRSIAAFALVAVGRAQIVSIVNNTLEKHSFGVAAAKETSEHHGSASEKVGALTAPDSSPTSHPRGARETDEYTEPRLSDEWRRSLAESATEEDDWTRDWSKQRDVAKGTTAHTTKEHAEVDAQIEVMNHAKSALEFMEERHAKRLTADTEEVDHLIHRKHLLTDRHDENDKDVTALEKRTKELEVASAKKTKEGKTADAKTIDGEVETLNQAAASIRGAPEEPKEIDRVIEADTQDGKIQDEEVVKLSKQREAIDLQVKLLERYGEDMTESAESAGGFSANDDDPYLKEAQAAMEQASGWSNDHLDKDVNKARDMLTNGISGKAPGKSSAASNALRGVS